MRPITNTLFVIILLVLSNSTFADTALVISNGGTKPPMHTEQYTGFIDVVLAEALSRIGYKLDTRILPNERSLINANRGVIDGESNRIAGMEREYPNLIRVPEKIMDWKFVAFSKQDIKTIQDWKSLGPYETAFINGWKIFEYHVPEHVSITKVRHPESLLRLLNLDRTDVILYELWQGLELIKKNNYKDIKVLSPPLASREMFIYLHKKNAHLVPRLAQALKEMKKDGTYNSMYQRILGPLEK